MLLYGGNYGNLRYKLCKWGCLGSTNDFRLRLFRENWRKDRFSKMYLLKKLYLKVMYVYVYICIYIYIYINRNSMTFSLDYYKWTDKGKFECPDTSTLRPNQDLLQMGQKVAFFTTGHGWVSKWRYLDTGIFLLLFTYYIYIYIYIYYNTYICTIDIQTYSFIETFIQRFVACCCLIKSNVIWVSSNFYIPPRKKDFHKIVINQLKPRFTHAVLCVAIGILVYAMNR